MRALAMFVALVVLTSIVCPAWAEDSSVKEYWLDNGMLVLLKENHNSPVINFNVAYRIGAKYDPAGLTGLSHYLEHMMFKSTMNLPCGEFGERLDAVGARKNAYTNLDKTIYHETIAADQIELALELEAERMCNLSLLDDEQLSEMTVICNELEQFEDNSFLLLNQCLFSTAFTAHPYRNPILGWRSDVETITTTDLKQHYGSYYHPDNAFIVAVGDFDSDELFAKIEKHFGPIPASGCVKPHITPEPEQQGERRFEIHRPGQANMLTMGWHIPASTNPDNFALIELSDILGTGITSRLQPQLIESNLCSNVMCFSKAFDCTDPALFIVYAALNPDADLHEVEGIILSELENIKANGVTDEELARARKLQRVNNILGKDDVSDEADTIADFEYLSTWKDAANYMPGIMAVTGEDIVRVTQQYLVHDHMTVGYYIIADPEADGPVAEMGSSDKAYHKLPDFTIPLASAGDAEVPSAHYAQDLAVAESAGTETVATTSSDDSDKPYATEHTLPNGLRVIIRENHNNESVSLSMKIPGGKITEPLDKPGLANFATNLLSCGTVNYSKRELGEQLESAGVSIGIDCQTENLDAASASLTEDFPLMLEMLSEMLLRPSFPEDEMEIMREQLSAAIKRGTSRASSASQQKARELLYDENNPFFGWELGTPESIASITRNDCVSWHDSCIKPDGSVLVIVGDVDPVETIALIEQHLGSWQGTLAGHDELLAMGADYKLDAEKRTEIDLPGRSNATLLWAGPGTSLAGEDWAAVQVAQTIFGNGMGSRLNKRLRVQDGLTYGAYAYIRAGQASGPFFVSVAVNPENIDKAIEATEEELARFAKDGITEDELQRAKNFAAGSYPVALSNNAMVARTLCQLVYLGLGLDGYLSFCDEIRAVTKEEVDAAAAKLTDPQNMKLIIAGTLN